MQIKSLLRFWFLIIIPGSLAVCESSSGMCPGNMAIAQQRWPARYSGSFGFEIMEDHNGMIIVSSADSTSRAYRQGVRPGMEILGWNTLPVRRKLNTMQVGRYRKSYPLLTDQNIRLMLLPRGRPGEKAEVFFMTPSGNNWGIRLTAVPYSP
jgi:hypothetical protein